MVGSIELEYWNAYTLFWRKGKERHGVDGVIIEGRKGSRWWGNLRCRDRATFKRHHPQPWSDIDAKKQDLKHAPGSAAPDWHAWRYQRYRKG